MLDSSALKGTGVEMLRNGCFPDSVELLWGLGQPGLELATTGLTLILRTKWGHHSHLYYVTDQNTAKPAQLLSVASNCRGDPTKEQRQPNSKGGVSA